MRISWGERIFGNLMEPSMNELLLVLGIFFTLFGIIEGLWTAIWVDGNSAPFTGRFTTVIWKVFRKIIPRRKDKLLSLAGPFILATTIVLWILFIWLGWTLIFYSDPTSILVKSTNSSPDFTDVIWYIAYTMFTVGNGDFLPQGDFWQVLSSFVAFTGMGMVTLGITYIFQVISAVTNKRAFASEVTGIGNSAEEFVSRQWTGENFGAIELQLSSLSSQLAKLNEQHMAFPILHYYHAAREEKSMDIAIAILDDSLSIIKYGFPEDKLPPETILRAARKSIETFLATVKKAFIKASENDPPKLKLSFLKDKGIAVKSDKEFYEGLEKVEKRRRLILGLMNNGAWDWPEHT